MTETARPEAKADQPPAPEGKTEAAATADVPPRAEVRAENVKVLLSGAQIGTAQIHVGASAAVQERPLEHLPQTLPSLPPHLHPFRDPRHEQLRRDLEARRILLLSSFQDSAAFAAAYSLAKDDHFSGKLQRALYPTRGRDRERSDLDFLALAEQSFLGETPQVLLIEIDGWCTLLDSMKRLGSGPVGSVRDYLAAHSSYVILVVDEDLLADEKEAVRAKSMLPYYAVSHLRYLLARDFPSRADELERRLLAGIAAPASPLELRDLHQRVHARLSVGVAEFEDFLRDWEQAASLPPAERQARLRPVAADDVVRQPSAVHRAAAFVATYLPGLSLRSFDELVQVLLGDSTSRVERPRQVLGANGQVTTVSEPLEERWSAVWARDADEVFADCHLRPVTSADGSWTVDFEEPYLRRELRTHFERRLPWYVKRQCQTLQESGALFRLDLPTAAVEGLVRLFVDRAVVDPASFGSRWLLDLVRSVGSQLQGAPASDAPEDGLAWLLEQLTVQVHLRPHFFGRLALLVREMLDREALRPTVRELFEFLIAAKQHDALLDLVLDLARRLRFAPHFDPLAWMRRLLDQGSNAVRQRTATRLIALATENGARIYEVLAAVRRWLPEDGRPVERFSLSSQLALELPFAYSIAVASWLPSAHFGAWPSRHPLFYALPDEPQEARREIASFIDWLLDPRGIGLESPDPVETMRTAEAVRLSYVADLVENWAWVLEGGGEDGPAEGAALFSVVLDELAGRLRPPQRLWLQRGWQRRQDEYLREAARADGPGRALLLQRRAKLDRLRERFAALADRIPPAGETPSTARGTAP